MGTINLLITKISQRSTLVLMFKEALLREKTPKSNLPFLITSKLNEEGEYNSVKLKGTFLVLTAVIIQSVFCDT